MTKEKILIIEDDVSILVGLVDLFSQEGYAVSTATKGAEGLEKYRREKPDLVLLDVMLPQKSGYELCKEIRRLDLSTGIIMLTAKGQEVDKVVGLELGADDYIVKPFGINELLARIRGVLRRQQKPLGSGMALGKICFGDVSIDPQTLEGQKGRHGFQVTLREVQILHLFLKNEGKIISRDALLEEVWGIKYAGTTRTVDQHIAKLRQKIENDPAYPQHLMTVHGVGYRFFSKNPSKDF